MSELRELTLGQIAKFRATSESGQELSVQLSPFLEACPLAECVTPEQVNIWKQVNQLTRIVSEAIHERFNEVLDNYRYTKKVRPIGPGIREHLEKKQLTYPRLQLMFGEQANKFLEAVKLDKSIQGTGKLTQNQGLVIFQLPAPLAKYWWKSDARLSKPEEPTAWAETDRAQRENMEDWEELQERIGVTGASTRGAESGIGGAVIEWGDIYDDVMSAFHEARDDFLKESDLRMIRVNENAQHDPNHYYYVWLAGQKEEESLEMPYDDDNDNGSLRYLSRQTLEKLRKGPL